ncbi:hypothetical protein [Bosea thiooxidans]
MLRIVILAAGLALLPAAAMAQGHPEGLRDPRFRPYALAQHPNAFIYSLPVSFGATLPQRRVVPSELPDEGAVSGYRYDEVSGAMPDLPRTRRIIQIIE